METKTPFNGNTATAVPLAAKKKPYRCNIQEYSGIISDTHSSLFYIMQKGSRNHYKYSIQSIIKVP